MSWAGCKIGGDRFLSSMDVDRPSIVMHVSALSPAFHLVSHQWGCVSAPVLPRVVGTLTCRQLSVGCYESRWESGWFYLVVIGWASWRR